MLIIVNSGLKFYISEFFKEKHKKVSCSCLKLEKLTNFVERATTEKLNVTVLTTNVPKVCYQINFAMFLPLNCFYLTLDFCSM